MESTLCYPSIRCTTRPRPGRHCTDENNSPLTNAVSRQPGDYRQLPMTLSLRSQAPERTGRNMIYKEVLFVGKVHYAPEEQPNAGRHYYERGYEKPQLSLLRVCNVIDACLVLNLSIELKYASRAISARLAACPRTTQQQSALSAVSNRHI
jgi:hypothetical protein